MVRDIEQRVPVLLERVDLLCILSHEDLSVENGVCSPFHHKLVKLVTLGMREPVIHGGVCICNLISIDQDQAVQGKAHLFILLNHNRLIPCQPTAQGNGVCVILCILLNPCSRSGYVNRLEAVPLDPDVVNVRLLMNLELRYRNGHVGIVTHTDVILNNGRIRTLFSYHQQSWGGDVGLVRVGVEVQDLDRCRNFDAFRYVDKSSLPHKYPVEGGEWIILLACQLVE